MKNIKLQVCKTYKGIINVEWTDDNYQDFKNCLEADLRFGNNYTKSYATALKKILDKVSYEQICDIMENKKIEDFKINFSYKDPDGIINTETKYLYDIILDNIRKCAEDTEIDYYYETGEKEEDLFVAE